MKTNLKNNSVFSEIKGQFGFGFMRFIPKCSQEEAKILSPDEIYDIALICKMVDKFLDFGYNYFDTAHGYMNEKSEEVISKCLVKRYKRNEFVLANKLSGEYFSSEVDIEEIFNKQLQACGVDYFDMYLMHAQGKKNYKKFKKYNAYEQSLRFKEEGQIKHFGISFHDSPDVLDQILNDYPQIEFAQIQLNYLDWEDPAIQSKKCLEVCNAHNVPVIVMEPLKGSRLFTKPHLALRFASTKPGVFMTLSGMNKIEQVEQNCAVMCGGKFEDGTPYLKHTNGLPAPLTDSDLEEINCIIESINKNNEIQCSACNYCIDKCSKHINIPQLIACYNKKKVYNDWNQDYYYRVVYTSKGRRASDCISCKKCEDACTQHLKISNIMKDISATFEKDLSKHT